jgi:hypothetical protein
MTAASNVRKMRPGARKATLSEHRLVARWRASACGPTPDAKSLISDMEGPLRHGANLVNVMVLAACGIDRTDLSDEEQALAFQVLALEISDAAREALDFWNQLHEVVHRPEGE